MNCEQAQIEIGGAPDETSAELAAHLQSCAGCRDYRAGMRSLDAQIRRAMNLSPPGLSSDVAVQVGGSGAGTRPTYRSRWAMAAGVLAAAVAVLLLWPARSAPALADELREHAGNDHELASWDNTAVVPQSRLDLVLRASGVTVDTGSLSPVVYAHTCWIRGRYVPHLVLRTSQGPLTVIPLVGEVIDAEQLFIESDYSGVLLPRPGGAIAVLARGRKDVSAAAQALGDHIRLQPAVRSDR